MVCKKIELAHLSERSAIFSKRKKDLFDKACELSVFYGARVAVLGFSPAGDPFAFGSPSVDAVVDEYLHKGQEFDSELSRKNLESSENGKLIKLNKQIKRAIKELKMEEKKMEKMDKGNVTFIPDDLGAEELLKVMAFLKKLRDEIEVAKSLLLIAKKPI
ncbi:agamous-like MADS-box protein AGL61 [Vicia villosa]|uniref:agamous-like MADS-box protein AGL61 n=1 Tax=Vicia villosa TaxID=3911 RepID=UPI00273CDF8B|nr:agamous-like MADS-box protein AGL61 [Vicia villosa]